MVIALLCFLLSDKEVGFGGTGSVGYGFHATYLQHNGQMFCKRTRPSAAMEVELYIGVRLKRYIGSIWTNPS